MKIRINKKHLLQGVKFKFIVANKPDVDKKLSFCYLDNIFYIINHFDDGKVYQFDTYQAFRKQLNLIIMSW